MPNSRPTPTLIAILLVLGLSFGISGTANAGDLLLQYSTDGGTSWHSFNSGFRQNGLQFSASKMENSAGTQAKLDLHIFNFSPSGATGNYDIIVQAALKGLSVPPSQRLEYAFTGSTDSSATMRTFLTSNSSPFDTTHPIFSSNSLDVYEGGGASLSQTPGFTLLTSIHLTGSQGDWVDLDGNASLVSAVPAPGGVVLVLTGLPLLGLLARARRRQKGTNPESASDAVSDRPPSE